MKEVTLEELLEAGCHFGHQVTRQNPKSRDFVFESRDNIHIIDLAKTKEGLDEALAYLKDLSQKGGSLMIIGTKRQAANLVKEEEKRIKEAGVNDVYTVTQRWIGGTLTNFAEVSKNYKKLKDLIARLQSEEERAKYTKKEVGLWEKEKNKLVRFFGGVADMTKLPDALFIIDTHLEDLAVKEASKMGIKSVGIVDTNADPALADYPIPANDDAVGSIKLILSYVVDAWIEGKKETKEKVEEKPKEEVKEDKTEKKEVKKKETKAKKEKKTTKKEEK